MPTLRRHGRREAGGRVAAADAGHCSIGVHRSAACEWAEAPYRHASTVAYVSVTGIRHPPNAWRRTCLISPVTLADLPTSPSSRATTPHVRHSRAVTDAATRARTQRPTARSTRTSATSSIRHFPEEARSRVRPSSPLPPAPPPLRPWLSPSPPPVHAPRRRPARPAAWTSRRSLRTPPIPSPCPKASPSRS